ncbi:hypothetical protein BU16DRAFT_16508 [Lophium mytilinum]|uniref:Uncharacterized protein n=1 Tax=Lophium mytilinum TaxID=390894 RepID=A0A6A6RG03_9PEZI|nr:hypothetical protein BU16DRAFT_16508 [Lophium mytilinum]
MSAPRRSSAISERLADGVFSSATVDDVTPSQQIFAFSFTKQQHPNWPFIQLLCSCRYLFFSIDPFIILLRLLNQLGIRKMDCIPLPIVCFQCGTDQNPCHCKVVGPTIGFAVTVVMAVVCWPASLFCCCCATETGKQYDSPSPPRDVVWDYPDAYLGFLRLRWIQGTRSVMRYRSDI